MQRFQKIVYGIVYFSFPVQLFSDDHKEVEHGSL